MVDRIKRQGSATADEQPTTRRAGETLDPTPPPDHQGFVDARKAGLRAMRENLARRKKTR